MIELLAPSGDFECLKAAVLNGANAVYIGGKEFSARRYAGNFDRDEMVEAVRFCHSYGVKVYVTMNTLYNDEELDSALKYAAFLYETGADALIIQDIGFLKLLREQLPEFELHGSTQMSVHNLDAVKLLYDMGVKRVVLARELSIKEIEFIAENTKAELEVFIHGALCICFSGQCLFSSMLGGRSGNRGRCAQPCRQEYSFENRKKAHFLSPKDLSTLEFIDGIVKSGVASLKIEGRMKKPEYVAGVVSSYKNALKGQLKKCDIDKVTQLFNRGGFTSYNLHEKQGSSMMSYERPGNWGAYIGKIVKSSDKFASIKLEAQLAVGDGVENFQRGNGALVSKIWVNKKETEKAGRGDIAEIYIEKARIGDSIYKSLDIGYVREAEESYKGKGIKRMPLTGKFTAKSGESISLAIENINRERMTCCGEQPEKALKTPTTREKVLEALLKTKDTPFYFKDLEIDMQDDLALPVSSLNSLRRRSIEGLIDKLQGNKKPVNVNYTYNKKEKNVFPRVACVTGNLEAAMGAVDGGCDILFYGGDALRVNKGCFQEIQSYNKGKTRILPWFPEIMLEDYEKNKAEIINYRSQGISEALCGNLGIYSFLKSNAFRVFLSSGFNIFNSEACDIFDNTVCEISRELNLKQINNLIQHTASETMVMVHGRIKLMVSRHCFIGSSLGHGCEGCPTLCRNKTHMLKDKIGEVFYVVPDLHCKNHIYNSKILCTIEHIKDIISMNADYLAINFLDESYDEALLTVKAYKEQLSLARERKFELKDNARELIDRLKGNITKGHFYRGVE